MSKSSSKALGGCFLGVYSMFITGPAWLVLLYQLLLAAGVPAWCWIIFYGYVPAFIFGLLVAGIIHAATGD